MSRLTFAATLLLAVSSSSVAQQASFSANDTGPVSDAIFETKDAAVATAASLVSKIASETGPVSLAENDACWATDELDTASRRVAANVSRLMPIGRFSSARGHI